MANNLIDGATEAFDQLTQNLGETTKTYLSLEKIIPNVTDLLVDQANDIRTLNKELGRGSSLAADFRKEVIQVSKNIGISSRETLRLVESTKEYHQGITDSTESTLKFSKASGVSINVIGKLSAKLNILGNVSSDTHQKMYENILAVREAYGLTSEQIDEVTDVLTDYAVTTQASDEQMERASITAAKFTSALTSVGIEAGRVTDILKGMIDPDKLTDNLVLMNKMGISVSDMISGDPMAKLEGSLDNLKQIGQEIANIAKTNRLQANEIAKVYGLTLQEATLLSELDTSEKALNTQKKLDEYRNETATLVNSLEALRDSITGRLAELINYALRGFEKLEGSLGLFHKGIGAIGTLIIGKFLVGKLKDGFLNLFGLAAKKFTSSIGDYLVQVENRSKIKAGEMAGLTPKSGGNDKSDNYGFGYNYGIRAAKKRDDYDRYRINNNIKKELNGGEIISSLQNQNEQLNALLIQYSGLRTKAEKWAFEKKYGPVDGEGGIKTRLSGVENLLKSTSSIYGYDDDLTAKITSYRNSNDKNKGTTATHVATRFLKNVGIDATAFGINASNNKEVAEIISNANNTKEALTGLYDFFKQKNMGEQVLEVKEALIKLDDKVAKSAEEINGAKEAIRANEQIIEGRGKGTFGNRLRAIRDGILTNIGTSFLKFKDSVISSFKALPMNLLKGFGKTLKIGGIAMLAGIGTKFMASLSKNEKFQKSMETITEKIGVIFDGLVKAAEPIIEPLANAVISIFNFIQPAIDWLSKLIGKVANFLGGKLDKNVSNISSNVSTISDSYKQEDLKTMIGGAAVLDETNKNLLAKLDDIYYKVVDVTKKQDIAAETSIAIAQQGQSGT